MTTSDAERSPRRGVVPVVEAGAPVAEAGAVRAVPTWPVVAVLVGSCAFVLRLVPVLRGGGLFGLGNYDDGVYFAAAVGFVHGLVPYRDFLLLHPPGIVLVLSPFAALGRIVGDADAFAVARVAFMALGAANAVLVGRLLRDLSLMAAVVGGLAYAFAQPAVFIGSSTILETPAATCLLLGLVLLEPGRGVGGGRSWWAGFLLGAGAGIKIWGAVVLVAVLVRVLAAQGRRRALTAALGGLVGAAAVCLPFLAAAGPGMWRMVVLDQLARGGSDTVLPVRVSDVLGLHDWQPGLTSWSAPTLAAGGVALVCVALACRTPVGRLAVGLLATTVALLLVVPSWYIHYAGLSAAPLALVVGAAVGGVPGHRGRWRAGVALVLAGLVVVGGAAGVETTFGRRFPAAALRPAVTTAAGCVTSDDPTTLVELGVLDDDLARGCPFVVDLSGSAYDLRTAGAPHVPRRQNAAWQQQTLAYLRSGTLTVVVRLSHAYALTARSARIVDSWPEVAVAQGFGVRRPVPQPEG